MEERKQHPHALQWHPAFYAGIQIELEAEADLLLFENEHQLGTKPKEIDVLIVKKKKRYFYPEKYRKDFQDAQYCGI